MTDTMHDESTICPCVQHRKQMQMPGVLTNCSFKLPNILSVYGRPGSESESESETEQARILKSKSEPNFFKSASENFLKASQRERNLFLAYIFNYLSLSIVFKQK